MISMKSNPSKGKLPVPPPRSQESVTAPKAAAFPDLPDAVDRKKHPELNQPPKAAKPPKAPADAGKTVGKLSALAAQIKDPERRAAVQKIEEEKAAKRSTKRAVKREIQKAKESGATQAMPLSGKDAQAALKAARKATASADGKTKVREAAKKVVAEVKRDPRSIYDWAAAELQAKSGTIPRTPPFTSYGPHLKKVYDMAKAGQAKELREYLAGFTANPCPPARKNLFRYGDLCVTAMKGAAAGGAGKRA